MRVVICTPALVRGDAVSTDVGAMADWLRAAGCEVLLATRFKSSEYAAMPLNQVPRALRDRDDLFIYHHSISCPEAVALVEKLKCRRVVKYHNVTPPEFFREINPEVARGCAEGLAEFERLAATGVPVWGDSPFNIRGLLERRPDYPASELPPFHQVDELLGVVPDEAAVEQFDDWRTNILCVGRLVPSKNVPRAVEAFAEYRKTYDADARLIVVGDAAQSKYCKQVFADIYKAGLEDDVVVTGKISAEQLKAIYLLSQAFLTTSLHEGFCVPIVEAMALRVPVVGLPIAAIPDTAGGTALLPENRPEAIAAALHEAVSGPGREAMIRAGFARYRATFANARIAERFGRLLAGLGCRFDEVPAGEFAYRPDEHIESAVASGADAD